jgi:hypothetical protein
MPGVARRCCCCTDTPKTHVMWHRLAPRLARDFSVVAPDLRGYGESSKPPTTADHEPYSKRDLAGDRVTYIAATFSGTTARCCSLKRLFPTTRFTCATFRLQRPGST